MSQPDAYLLLQDGQQTGPFPLETLQQMVETGTIQRDDFVWKDGMPDWPDFDGFGELFTKAIQWLAVVAVSFGPAIFLGIAAEKEESDGLFIGTMAAFVVGGIYFPMAILSVGMHDSVGGLNPLGVFHGIFKIPGHYLVTLVVFFVLAGVQFLASQLSGMIPIGGALIDKLDELWSAVFLSRVLGGLYYVNRRKLSWFGE